ncbi:hypothetical protein V6N12_050638 [Hibiscus sabdariffa]|uniref:Integrase catalytic domain-containing protein n=1 Tax=Hibiscus sabdariffa TaxID=183260 RepID=A0ABR2GDA2_9ROSI
MDWRPPKNVSEVRSFLDLAGYYKRFVKGFSTLASPITKLLWKDVPFVWSENQQKSFDQLKQVLKNAPVLVQPESGKDFTNDLNLMQRRCRWMELLKDYDLVIDYHPGNANVVADALSRMKAAITNFVSRCLTCQKVKVEHQAPTRLLQPIEFPQWKWDKITMDFVTGLPGTPKKNDVVWVIVDSLTKSTHFISVRANMSSYVLVEFYIREVIRLHGIPTSIVSDRDPKFTSRFWNGENKVLGPQILRDTEEKVQITHGRLKQAFDRQKAYADLKRTDMQYDIGDKVFLKVSPSKKVLRFGKKGKLSPRYNGPFEILERFGPMAYRLALPPEFDKIHNVFHVSMLQRYRYDPSHILEPEEMKLNPDLSYEEEPV